MSHRMQVDFKFFANDKNKLESHGQKFRNFNHDTRMQFGIEKCFDVDNEHWEDRNDKNNCFLFGCFNRIS